jgi:hypothetical protein
MKSKIILKKTLGVLIIVFFTPAILLVFESFSDTPDYYQTIKTGFVINIFFCVMAFLGWQVGRALAWCFNKNEA